jgi:hypothetical protein
MFCHVDMKPSCLKQMTHKRQRNQNTDGILKYLKPTKAPSRMYKAEGKSARCGVMGIRGGAVG